MIEANEKIRPTTFWSVILGLLYASKCNDLKLKLEANQLLRAIAYGVLQATENPAAAKQKPSHQRGLYAKWTNLLGHNYIG